MTTSLEVNYMGINLDVKGKYTPEDRGDHSDPGYFSEFEIIRVMLGSTDISPLLSEKQITEIEILAIEKIES